MRSTGFAVLLGLNLVLAPLPLQAQQPGSVYRVGLLFVQDRQATPYPVLLRERLRDLGYREGQEVAFEERFVEGSLDRLSTLADDLVRRRVDVIVTWLDTETLAAKRATDSIPIIVLAATDPVNYGFVASLARPGGNITGLTFDAGFEVASKRIEILKETIPSLKSVGFLYNPEYRGLAGYIRVWKETTDALGLKFQVFEARDFPEVRAALPRINRSRPGALFIGGGWPLTADQRRQIADFMISSRIPTLVLNWAWMRSGGLMAYLSSDQDRATKAAALIDKILKGTRPAELPVEQPTKFELVINLRTAKALRVIIPPSVLGRADHVIE